MRGLTVRFSPEGQFESDQLGGMETNNTIADYVILSGVKLVIEKDTSLIERVDDNSITTFETKMTRSYKRAEI